MTETISQKQQDIYNEWATTNRNVVVRAVAGSGKTTTLMGLLRRCRFRTLFLSFNKTIQQEIQGRIEAEGLTQGKAMTLHSLGFKAVQESLRLAGKRYRVDKNLKWDMVKRVMNTHRGRIRAMPWKKKTRLNFCLQDLHDTSRLFLTDDLTILYQAMVSIGKNPPDIDDTLRFLWQKLIEERERQYTLSVVPIDFIDMIYLPVLKNLDLPIKPYYLFVDEAQDLSLLQHRFVSLLLNQGVRKWIAVGDPRQSIYLFSGAFANSFEAFVNRPNTVELPLDICYRCGDEIIEEANEVYDVMEGTGKEGEVEETDMTEGIESGAMIVCRNTAPLIDLYFELIGSGKEACLVGDDILKSIKRFLSPYKRDNVQYVLADCAQQIAALPTKSSRNDAQRLQAWIINQNIKILKKIVNNLRLPSSTGIGIILQKVDTLFVRTSNAIILCTIHKSKGLEADIVYILNEGLIPSKFAITPEQLVQEQNLKYVARTRAKNKLGYLTWKADD